MRSELRICALLGLGLLQCGQTQERDQPLPASGGANTSGRGGSASSTAGSGGALNHGAGTGAGGNTSAGQGNTTAGGAGSSEAGNGGTSGETVSGPIKAIMLIDARLYSELKPELDAYRKQAEARRGFGIALHAVPGIDDQHFSNVRSYLIEQRTKNPELEGVLFIGNIKLPSFYKTRNDIILTRIYPLYYEDLDATWSKRYATGSIDPLCTSETEPHCAVNGPVPVPDHDFDHVEKGTNPDTELWTSYMPVGSSSGSNSFADFAAQLRPYLNKVLSFYAGKLTTNGRYYYVSNDRGERMDQVFEAFGKDKIDFYGKAGAKGEVGNACITSDRNLCYVRWPMETYADYAAFESAFSASPWVAEGWQEGSIFLSHMNAALYQVAQVNVHSADQFSLVSSAEAKNVTKGGLLVVLDGCGVGGFSQPNSPSYVDDPETRAADNIMLAYLYGKSQAIAALGDPTWRGHYANHPTIYLAMKRDQAYLGKAHWLRMGENYVRAGSNPLELKEHGGEMLMGDPFMDFR